MPETTKITLSENELSLVKNADWILTKQVIIQTAFELFAKNIATIKAAIAGNGSLPESVRSSEPKIYKGENYLQLPYVIMDYPRCFDKENIFAIRTMFWWGNFFSITLHLAGEHKVLIKKNLCSGTLESIPGLFIGVNENQWQHHFEEDNFLPYAKLTRQQRLDLFDKNTFVKLAIKFGLDQWNEMPAIFMEGYNTIARLLFNYQADEKDL